ACAAVAPNAAVSRPAAITILRRCFMFASLVSAEGVRHEPGPVGVIERAFRADAVGSGVALGEAGKAALHVAFVVVEAVMRGSGRGSGVRSTGDGDVDKQGERGGRRKLGKLLHGSSPNREGLHP